MIKVVHEGIEFHCESAEEAMDIAARLRGLPGSKGKSGVSPAGHAAIANSRWTVSRFNTFISQLREKQRRFLSELVAAPDGVTDTKLRQSFGVSNNKGFGPILTGISRRAKKSGVSFQDVVISEKVQLSAGETVLEFKAAPAFAAVAKEAGGIKG